MDFNKIKKWLLDKENRIFLIILGIGIFIRLYYLFITYNQPLWWDEAEYLLMAKYFAGQGKFLGLLASRPLLLSLIAAFFMKIGLNYEIIYRFIEFGISSLGLVFIYLTAKKLFNKEVGIASTLLLSVFYLHLFYTSRILLDSISPTFWVISIYFFVEGYLMQKDNKKFYLSAFFGAIGVFFYNQTIGVFLLYLIFLLIIEKLNLFKEKRFYIFGLVAIITFLPNFILNQILYNNPIEFITTGISVGNVLTSNYWQNIMIYLNYFPNYLGIILLIIFLISIVLVFYKLVIGIDLLIKKPDLEMKKELLLLLWLIVPFFLIIKIVGHFEDRYLMPIFIPLFIISSLGLYKIKQFLTRPSNKSIIYAIAIILLIIISYTQILQANQIINAKKDSFKELKDAGLWIKQNSNPTDKILTSFTPILPYYSERQIVSFPGKEEEIMPLIEKEKPKYMLLSAFTGNPGYINNLSKYTLFKPVNGYQIGGNTVLVIFEIDYNQIKR